MRDPIHSELHDKAQQFFLSTLSNIPVPDVTSRKLSQFSSVKALHDFSETMTAMFIEEHLKATDGKFISGEYSATWEGDYGELAKMIAEDTRIVYEKKNDDHVKWLRQWLLAHNALVWSCFVIGPFMLAGGLVCQLIESGKLDWLLRVLGAY